MENTVITGIDYLTKLCYKLIDESDAQREEKRDLLYSLYAFRALFDTAEVNRLSKTLLKYNLSFLGADENQKNEGAVKITDKNGKTAYKYDIGSPLWVKKVKSRELTGEAAVLPQKLTMYEMADKASLLSTQADFKAMWMLYMPFILLSGAPAEYDIYEKLKERLLTEKVFEAALDSRYSDLTAISADGMAAENSFAADWFAPFIEWKNEKDIKGVSREVRKFQKALAKAEFLRALENAELMLDLNPYDEEVLLLSIAARASLSGSKDKDGRIKLSRQNLDLINSALKPDSPKYVYYLYYRGLSKLGVGDDIGAEEDFNACLKENPSFEIASLMLAGIKNARIKSSELN